MAGQKLIYAYTLSNFAITLFRLFNLTEIIRSYKGECNSSD